MALGEYLGAGSSITKGLYHFNGNSNDSSGNGYNGTDTAITYVDGINGSNSASFNGSTSKIATGNDRWSFTGDFTIAFKFKPNNLTSYQAFVSNFNITPSVIFGYGYIVRLNTSGKLELVIANDSSVVLADTTTLTTGQEYRVVVKRLSGVGSYIYLDGSLVASNSSTFNPGYAGTYHSTIGCLEYLQGTYQTAQFYNGTLDEVILDNRGWSDAEISRYNTFSKGRY